MRARQVPALVAATLTVAGAATAQTPPPIPPVVLTHMNSLEQRCTAAGGQPVNARYVHAQDFTGDGRLDYLLSEGDYACAGRPGLFRPDGQARVDIFVTDARGVARRVFSDTLMAYRLVAGRPVRVQIARKGAACGPSANPATQCATQLAWNGQAFGEGVAVTREAGEAGAASSASQTAGPAGASPAGLSVAPDARPKFLERCRRDYVSRDASASRWADDQCRTDWAAVVQAGPAADALLAVIPASPAARATLAAVRQQAVGVRWTGGAQGQILASGKLGDLDVTVEGRGGAPTAVGIGWSEVGAMIPYDVANAMRARGVTLAEVSCEKLGTGEGGRTYTGTVPGRAPFALRVDQRTAPTADASSYYGATVSLDRRHPPRGSTMNCDF